MRTPEHVDYPHTPGYLITCAACEDGPCVCNAPTDAPCVSRECQQINRLVRQGISDVANLAYTDGLELRHGYTDDPRDETIEWEELCKRVGLDAGYIGSGSDIERAYAQGYVQGAKRATFLNSEYAEEGAVIHVATLWRRLLELPGVDLRWQGDQFPTSLAARTYLGDVTDTDLFVLVATDGEHSVSYDASLSAELLSWSDYGGDTLDIAMARTIAEWADSSGITLSENGRMGQGSLEVQVGCLSSDQLETILNVLENRDGAMGVMDNLSEYEREMIREHWENVLDRDMPDHLEESLESRGERIPYGLTDSGLFVEDIREYAEYLWETYQDRITQTFDKYASWVVDRPGSAMAETFDDAMNAVMADLDMARRDDARPHHIAAAYRALSVGGSPMWRHGYVFYDGVTGAYIDSQLCTYDQRERYIHIQAARLGCDLTVLPTVTLSADEFDRIIAQ